MNRIILVGTLLSWSFLSVASGQTYTPGQQVDKDFAGFAQAFLTNHCVECHGKTEPEGNLSLHDLGPVNEVNSGTWKAIWAQVTLKEMPPKDADQPGVIGRLQFSDWIVSELTRVMRDQGGFRAHLDPNKGNFVDHALLFGPLPKGIKLAPASSPARIWRVTPQEYITRLNELINREPEFDPGKPGQRTRGDVVPTNHGGELKLYFGTDRIIRWEGGTVAYATAVKSVPAVLSSARNHGLENYPDFYTVNSAEATQILSKAENILQYMAYGPLSLANPEQITDDPKTYDKVKPEGDLRGLPTAIVYSTKIMRPLTPVYHLMKDEGISDKHLRDAVDYLFEALTFRLPSKEESDTYLAIVKQSIEKLGKEDGAILGLSSIFLDRDALFRPELADNGKPDQHGRVMLQDSELGLAVNHALSYIKPDEQLRKAILEGRMRTRADVKREVERMLADNSIRKPRILRFFRDYFDHDLGGYICKDSKALADTGASNRGQAHYRAMFDATASSDRLIELILQEDKDVLRQLLTTDKVVATNSDRVYFGKKRTKEEVAAAVVIAKKAAEEQVKKDTVALKSLEKEVAKLESQLRANPKAKETQRALDRKKKTLVAAMKKVTAAKKKRAGGNHSVAEAKLSGPKMYARVSRRSFGNGSMKPTRILATAPAGQRLGLLTHPSWLVSHSDAMDNHAILRGRWIRERLLGGGIPDVPITVDAMLPDEPQNTLRERMQVTRKAYCWTCHKKMDPLGLPFEMYNHAGLYRETELNKPVDTTGEIIDSGDPTLDGKVANAIEMIEQLAESKRVEQVFVRHAFRFWMGRNETLNDAPVLQEAYRVYKESGGSMNALITSLVTSDAFLYRKVERPAATR
ncbi:MAG: DUF1588 domain-containing protein [Planctomycetaceae bacterium]|nr:DUF1588 domain-containing protein [Planctomycetaceae bacterium]